MSEASNFTGPWVPPACSSENWSNESALAVLFALAIGCLAHPRGSLTYSKSGRIWRLSPHLGFVEALNLISKAAFGAWRGYSLNIICVTLLAVRAGNSWTSTEYESFQEDWRKEQRQEKHRISNASEDLGQGDDNELIPPVGRSQTIEAEEGRANMDLHRRIPRVGGPHGKGDPKDLTEEVQEASPDAMFLAQLDETERYEKGFTFRVMAWIPMLLSAVKLCAVKGYGGIWSPKVCGWMFVVSWFVVELLTVVASRHQLSEDEREKALMLSQQWRKTWSLRAERQKTIEDALINPFLIFLCFLEVDGGFILGRITCTILLGFNAWPLVAQTAGSYFFPHLKYSLWLDSFLWQPDGNLFWRFCMIPVELSTLFGFVFCPFIFYALFYFGLVYLIISPWAFVLLNLLCAFLVLRRGIPASTLRVSTWWQAMKMEDMDCLVPGYLALLQAILTVLRCTRVLNDYASYDCSTTTKASWYDWTL
jgi:hypothetical protein